MPSEPLVVADDLVKRWGTQTVLTGANFEIAGGITGLLGSNGAGKTTLIGMLLGLHRPNAGRLTVFGLDPSTAGADIRSRVGYSPEHHHVPPDLRAHDFVRHIAEIHGLPGREATARASEALFHVGLGEERFRPLGTMSTGQRQRVKLAQAIAHDPLLVLLDEPTDGLDPVQRDQMLNLIRRIGTEMGIHVLLSSHLLEEVERVCDTAVILADGRVAAQGTLSELTGATGTLVVDLQGDVDGFCALARAAGATVDSLGPTLRLQAEPDTPLGADGALALLVRDLVADEGLAIRRLQTGRRSLEDFYLELATSSVTTTESSDHRART